MSSFAVNSTRKILVVDDEAISRENIMHALEKIGYQVLGAESGEAALAILDREKVDLILTDLRMPKVDGMAVLAAVRERCPEAETIVITGYASVESAIEAMRKGAYHYVAKPVNLDELRHLVEKALERSSLQKEITSLRQWASESERMSRIIGRSSRIQAMRDKIMQVAQFDCNVLILGETGTGKELVARTLHELSPRADNRFVAFNCGVFTEDLIASELFGHEQGAFTGAAKVKKGLLEIAEGGTVFFDEIGELTPAMQVKLLRVLQEHTLMRVGGSTEIPVDIRVLAATNKNLKQEAEAGLFRQDLFFRLDVITIQVPPLAERREDIPLLANHFLAKHTPPDRTVPILSAAATEMLKRYDYPGNIRELENIVHRLLIMCNDNVIEPRHLPTDLSDGSAVVTRETDEHHWPTLEEQEKRYIMEVLDKVEGNRSQAAKILGIDRVSLWRKIKRFGLEDPEN